MSEFNGILTLTVFLPALAGLVILLVKPLQLEDRIIRWFAIVSTVVTFVLTLIVFLAYDRDAGWRADDRSPQLAVGRDDQIFVPARRGWTECAVGVAHWNFGNGGGVRVTQHRTASIRVFPVAVAPLESAVMGVFVSLDLLLFFVFFEFEVIPMFMLISLWGSGRPRYSAMKFVLYTLAGGAFMFVGIFAVYLTGALTP